MTNFIDKNTQKYFLGDVVITKEMSNNDNFSEYIVTRILYDNDNTVIYNLFPKSGGNSGWYSHQLEATNDDILELSEKYSRSPFLWRHIQKNYCNVWCKLKSCNDCPISSKYKSLMGDIEYIPNLGDTIEISTIKNIITDEFPFDKFVNDDIKYYGRIDCISYNGEVSNLINAREIPIETITVSGQYTTKLGYTVFPKRFSELKSTRINLVKEERTEFKYQLPEVSEFICNSCIFSDCFTCKFKINDIT